MPFINLQDRPGSLLIEHLRTVSKLTVERMAACLGDGLTDELRRTAEVVGLCHDLGKGTSYFQDYIRDAENQRRNWTLGFKRELTHHSRLGAEAAAFILRRGLGENSLLPLLAYSAILRHHGGLGDLTDEVGSQQRVDTDKLKQQLDSMDNELWRTVTNTDRDGFGVFLDDTLVLARMHRSLRRLDEDESFRFFLLGRLLYSCLLWADRADASGTEDYKAGSNPADIVDKYRKLKGFDKPEGDLNEKRNRAYEEVIGGIRELKDDTRLFTLTLPTGLGKTLTGLAAALGLRQKRNLTGPVVYCLPFTAIIDQNARVYREVLNKEDAEPTSDRLLIHHHLAEGGYRLSTNKELDPDAGHLLLEGWESDLVVTTFVQLCLTLFNNHNRSLRRLHRLAGAVVILDEVQNIPVRYWDLFRKMLKETARLLDTHWVLMTATQPVIFTGEDGAVELAGEPDTYFRELERTELVNEMPRLTTLEKLSASIHAEQEGKRILVVVNTIRCAGDLYRLLKKAGIGPLYYLSGDVIPKHRLERIGEMKDGERPLVCVSTQLIEAGVDLDFDVVYRDLAPLDSVIQAAGRCNRGGESNESGRVVVVRLQGAEEKKRFADYIYDQTLLTRVETALDGKETIPEAEYRQLIGSYYTAVDEATSDKMSRDLLKSARLINHRQLAEAFKLIDDEDYEKVDVFVMLDNEAEDAWREYIELSQLKSKGHRNRMRKLKPRMAPYIISVPKRYWHEDNDNWLELIDRDSLIQRYDTTTGYIRK